MESVSFVKKKKPKATKQHRFTSAEAQAAGRKGGQSRWRKLTFTQRRELAQRLATARWEKARGLAKE